ncbi:Crp/Fnr family transcriptional regulator [Streptomyces macrosporus]
MSIFEDERPFLDALPPHERKALTALGRPKSYAPGDVLLLESDTTSFVVAILSGWAMVSVETERGVRLILALRGAGEIVGDQAAIDHRPRSATITALGRMNVVVIPADRFRAYVMARPAAGVLLMRQLSSRLRSSDDERRSLASEKVLQRLAARLVELAERTGRAVDDGIAVDLPLPQHDIAAAVGATREAVAKALRFLRDQGAVRTASRRFVVVDLGLLRLLAESGTTGERAGERSARGPTESPPTV